jgi:predicted component of type VI protein secretion system
MLMPGGVKPAPMAVLSGEDVRKVLDRDLLIGRGEGVDLKAQGLFVRPVHARINVQQDGGFHLTCLAGGSARVNGRKLRSAELAFGDRLLIGRSLFRLERPKGGPAR